MLDTEQTTRRAIRILSFAYFIQATVGLSVVGCLEPISTEWGLTESESALLLAIFGITFAISAPLMQVKFGHFSRRLQSFIGLSLIATGTIFFAFSQGHQVLILSRIIMGLGAGILMPVLTAMGSDIVKKEDRGRAIATILLGLSLSGMLGTPSATWIAYNYGIRELFLVFSFLCFICLFLISAYVPDKSIGNKISIRKLTKLLKNSHSLATFLVVFFISTAVFSTYSFLSPIIRDIYAGGPTEISIALLTLGISGVIGNYIVIHLATLYSSETLLLRGISLLSANVIFLITQPPMLVWLLFALAIWALSTDIIWPTQQRRVVELFPDSVGVALAITGAFLFSGIGLGSTLAGLIYPYFGYLGVMLCTIFFLALAKLSLCISIAKNQSRTINN